MDSQKSVIMIFKLALFLVTNIPFGIILSKGFLNKPPGFSYMDLIGRINHSWNGAKEKISNYYSQFRELSFITQIVDLDRTLFPNRGQPNPRQWRGLSRSDFGPLYHRFNKAEGFDSIPAEQILWNRLVEVYFAPALGELTDPIFRMVTSDDVCVDFAYTGDLLKMSRLAEDGKKYISVLEMDAQHRFTLYRGALPVDGVVDNPRLAPEQILEQLITYAFARTATLNGMNPFNGLAKDFSVLTYDKVVARFKLMQTLSSTDIIPDQSPRTGFIKAGDGCKMPCVYCPERNATFVPYTEGQFRRTAQETKTALLDILGEERLEKINEIFLNISDLVRLDIALREGKTDLSAKRAAEIAREFFPWAEKIGSFVSTKSALEMSEDPEGTEALDGKTYSFRYFRELFGKGMLVNRLYLGLETAHTEGSRLLGKPTTYEQSQLAARLIQGKRLENIPLKVIVQIGVLGKGFYTGEGRFVPWQESTDTTRRWIGEVAPYRVLESVYQPYEGLPIIKLMVGGRIVPYDNPDHIGEERKRLREGLDVVNYRRKKFRIDGKYEQFLPPPSSGRGSEKIVRIV